MTNAFFILKYNIRTINKPQIVQEPNKTLTILQKLGNHNLVKTLKPQNDIQICIVKQKILSNSKNQSN